MYISKSTNVFPLFLLQENLWSSKNMKNNNKTLQ